MAMNSSAKIYQNFEPRFDWVHHPDSHVLIVPLLGFKRNQLRIQVTSTGKLRIAGERRLESRKWLRFQKEIEVPADADTDKVTAKMEDGVLYLRQPKKPTATSNIPPEKPQPKAETLPPAPTEKPKAETLSPVAAPEPAAAKRPSRQDASESQNGESRTQAIGKQSKPPPKDKEPPKPTEAAVVPARTQKSAEQPQPDQEAAVKKSTDDQKQTDGKSEAHPKLKHGLEEKEGVGSKMAEGVKEGTGSKMAAEEGGGGGHGRGEKEGGAGEERRGKKRRGEMVEGERRRGYKLEVRMTTMAALVLGVVAFVILYLNLTNKGNVEGEL